MSRVRENHVAIVITKENMPVAKLVRHLPWRMRVCSCVFS
jgi:antitoxin (DNA-binding transcriptional repressor) of toxin-antitoxin stability system